MQQPEPYISIIVPSYNRATFLEKRIPDLLKLDYLNYEIIVVDDGSTDNTSAVFDKIKAANLRYYKKQNEERAAARNYGAVLAIGDYITFMDSDDQLYPDALKNAAAALKEKGYPAFLHMAYDIGTEDHISKHVTNIKDNEPRILIVGNPLSCMGVFIKKEIFQLRKFNPDRALAGSEDWELWLRLAANYGLRTDKRIVGRLIQHDTRSVIKVSEESLLLRKNLSLQYAFEDKAVQKLFSPYKNKIEAYMDTYISLHLAMGGIKARTWHYLIRAVICYPMIIFTKRSLIIIKLLIFKKRIT